VLGALTVYLLLGLFSAFLYGVVADLERLPFFGADGRGTPSDYVYFSFTALTTTGFGNLAPATALGRAVTTFEMVIGQLYLVTVVAVLVGSLPGRARAARQGPGPS
jgi:Ion channel